MKIDQQKITTLSIILSVFFLLNIIGAAIMLPLEPDLDYINSFYLMMTTSTTVGYGNIAPETNGGKMFISFYQLVLVAFFFGSLSVIF